MAPSDAAWARFDPATATLELRIHAQPGGRRSEVVGIHGDRIKLRIAARAVDGRANAALLKYVAVLFGVALRDVELAAGASHRDKTLRVRAPRLRPDRGWVQEFDARS